MSFPRYPEYKDSGVEWLGEVPAHWDTKPIKSFSTCNDEVIEDSTDPDYEIEYIEISGVNANNPNIETTQIPFGQAPSRARRRLKNGDVIVSTVRTYLRAIAPIINPPENLIASTGFAVIRPRIIDPGFLGYIFQAEYIIAEVIARSVGVSYPAINASELIRLKAPVPENHEQVAIAAFLNHETAKIDELISEQEKLIALLKEKRQAVISHAVTKGLDPNVKMKDSGIEWLGEVPKHWEVKQLKRVVKPGTSITYGIVQAGPHFEGGIPYIKTSDMSGDKLPLDGYSLTSPEIDNSYARSKVECGDLVVAIRATIGKCLLVPDELSGANLTQGTAKISPGPNVNVIYLFSLINSPPTQAYFDCIAKGATFREITLDGLRRATILVPPLNEQEDISIYVSKIARKIDEMSESAINAVDVLKERRIALISAAVTGKIDVRGAA